MKYFVVLPWMRRESLVNINLTSSWRQQNLNRLHGYKSTIFNISFHYIHFQKFYSPKKKKDFACYQTYWIVNFHQSQTHHPTSIHKTHTNKRRFYLLHWWMINKAFFLFSMLEKRGQKLKSRIHFKFWVEYGICILQQENGGFV